MANCYFWSGATLVLLCFGAAPALQAARVPVIDVTKFGAVAGDGKDDTAAMLAAFEQCKKTGPATLAI
ncbi:MAG: hypothetical protein ACPL7K_04300, partial [Armatimonadota bacterium]